MSRIHEALKKAEEQRSASQGGRIGEPVQPAEAVVTEPVTPGAPLGEGTPASANTNIPSFGSPYTLDTLLARCPQVRWSPDRKTMLFFSPEEQEYGSEEFRTLRSRLHQIREKQSLKKVLVTSALPKEGKSFVAANLAQVMVRQEGRRALLIDSDLRGSRLHDALGTSPTPGLSDYLLGEKDEFAVIQRGQMENLFFIPSGRTVANPAELVANGRMRFLLNRLEPLFDWIIIDSPPAVPVSDAGLLANYCDGVLMVVRSNATPFDVARKARQEFRDKHLVGVVLNGISTESSYTQYYYATYGRTNGRHESQG
jgi:protein-tyrosine kinase